ncbi:tetratricopeptide repeat protein, partial [Pelagicoccus mobilis]
RGYNLDLEVEGEIAELAAEFPGSPVPSLMEAGYLYWVQNYLKWDETMKVRFEEKAEVALEVAKAYLAENEGDADAQFAVGMVELMQVIYYVDHHRWWAAFWKTRSSLKTMRRLAAEYPDYHDAKLPLGMQNCYLSRPPAYLKPLAFLMRFKGDWELGLRYMREARDGGLFCRTDAGYYLAEIWIELEGDKRAARDELAKLVERFPGNLKFQARLAELDRGLGKQVEARERALEVLGDERLAAFPAIEGEALTTLLWSSLASQALELAVETADRVEVFLDEFPEGEGSQEWAAYVRAEAVLGLGDREKAVKIWREVAKGDDADAAKEAKRRLAEEVRD